MNIAYDRKSHYFCSEFVSEVLEMSNALELQKHPSLMRPADYTKIEELNCLFDGKQMCIRDRNIHARRKDFIF